MKTKIKDISLHYHNINTTIVFFYRFSGSKCVKFKYHKNITRSSLIRIEKCGALCINDVCFRHGCAMIDYRRK